MRIPAFAALLLLPTFAYGGFTASSWKRVSRSQTSSPYDAAAALDGKPETAWLVDPEKGNIGQWIEIDVPQGKVDKISVLVGWGKSDDAWVDHARLKKARVEIFSMAGGTPKLVMEKVVEAEDIQTLQTIDIPGDPEVGDEFDGGKVKITVVEVYPGKDFEHLALAEVLVHMIEFDAFTRNFTTSSSIEEGHGGDLMVDDSTKTFWANRFTDREPSFAVNAGRYSASSIGITSGPKSYARPKRIRIEQSSAILEYNLEDTTKTQWFQLPTLFGYTGSNFGDITVSILETYEGGSEAVAIADVKFKATALEAF